jgi:hypothetical protein
VHRTHERLYFAIVSKRERERRVPDLKDQITGLLSSFLFMNMHNFSFPAHYVRYSVK